MLIFNDINAILKLQDRVAPERLVPCQPSCLTAGATTGRLTMLRIKYPSQEEIKEVLNYNPETGIFTWKAKSLSQCKNKRCFTMWKTKYEGKPAGSLNNRYVTIEINKRPYHVHRLAWIYVYGYDPIEEFDHKNRNKKDNWIDNLRFVTRSQNNQNKGLQKNNVSGVCGAFWSEYHKKWVAQIKVNNIPHHLGLFKEFNEAVTARRNAEIKHGFTEFQKENAV